MLIARIVNNAAMMTASLETVGPGWEAHMAVKYDACRSRTHQTLVS